MLPRCSAASVLRCAEDQRRAEREGFVRRPMIVAVVVVVVVVAVIAAAAAMLSARKA